MQYGREVDSRLEEAWAAVGHHPYCGGRRRLLQGVAEVVQMQMYGAGLQARAQ